MFPSIPGLKGVGGWGVGERPQREEDSPVSQAPHHFPVSHSREGACGQKPSTVNCWNRETIGKNARKIHRTKI